MIDQFLEIIGVSYVFVVDAQGEIISHTFVPSVPEEIVRIKERKNEDRRKDSGFAHRGERVILSTYRLAYIRRERSGLSMSEWIKGLSCPR